MLYYTSLNAKCAITAILRVALLLTATPNPPQKVAFIYVKHGKAKISFKLFIEPIGNENKQ